MITVLERQRVVKRSASPVHLRARSEGVRWNSVEHAAPSPHPDFRPSLGKQSPRAHRLQRPREVGTHRLLKGQLIRVKRQRRPRRKEEPTRTAHPGARAEGADTPGRAARRSIAGAASRLTGRRGPLVAACILVLGAVITAIATLGMPLAAVHPAIPAPADTDPALYALLVPEPATAREELRPVVLTNLAISSYRTQAGDSLSKIAARFKLNVDTLVSWNGIRDARSIAVGTQLGIPNTNGLKYTVRRGDSLQRIALSSSVPLNSILDWNRLSSSVISVGQELFLPGARMNTDDLNRILGSLFQFPVIGRISSYYGERPDPFTGVERPHNGIDIVNKPQTPILAAANGTVADVGFNNNYGNYIILKHSGFFQTLYGHLNRYLVSRGQKVRQGQEIGQLGTTGYSTGPHLHFSIFRNGEAIDPLRFLK
jgi:murein DD-endopeptidase MepM/ murein hydrolase activator NlpD